MKHIHRYYSPNDLYNTIIDGLNTLGTELTEVTLDDLQPGDEFHIRGSVATGELIRLSEFTPAMHILDVGCGIGGSTRRLAHETGCRVTGIDLSDEYIDTAQLLTQLLNMEERVAFYATSALDLPFDDHSFDGVWSIQMNMNVEDKLAWLKEVFRVLKPGGRAVLYEVCGNRNAPIYVPVPWAQDSTMSFLVPPEAFRTCSADSGDSVSNPWTRRVSAVRATADPEQRSAGLGSWPTRVAHGGAGESLQCVLCGRPGGQARRTGISVLPS